MPKKRSSLLPRPSKANNVVSIIMAGGIGTRLWPLGTPKSPKQFLRSLSKKSLFEQTVERALTFSRPEKIFVVTNKSFRGVAQEQAKEIPSENILLEPQRKDTAAAIVLAAFIAERKYPGHVSVVMPADHMIKDSSNFKRTIDRACRVANEGKMVLLGIQPTFAATEYGYLKLAKTPVPSSGRQALVKELEAFVEKPDRKRADKFIRDGNYLWNSGIFIWRQDILLKQTKRYLPGHYQDLERALRHYGRDSFARELKKSFAGLRGISIDYGILEKSDQLVALAADFNWSDLGTWPAVEQLVSKDGDNRTRGEVCLDNSQNSLIINQESKPVMGLGLNNMVVINTKAGLLVCDKKDLSALKGQIKKLLREK